MTQFVIEPSTSDPMPAEFEYLYKTVIEGGSSMFYDPIPFEMLNVFSEVPQINVTVGDMPAVCFSPENCKYTYINQEGKVASVDYSIDGTL